MVIVIRDAQLPADIAYASTGTDSVIRMRADLITEEGARALSDTLTEVRRRYFPVRPPIAQDTIAS